MHCIFLNFPPDFVIRMEEKKAERVMNVGRFVPKREELTRNWRKLHGEESLVLYCLSNVPISVKEDETGSECGMCGGEEKCLQGRNEDKRQLGRPRW
jgi:hypothetical protein